MSEYREDAESDAQEMVSSFKDQIVDQLIDKGEASIDLFNDYAGGDRYHQENHVDKSYTFQEAAELLTELSDYEETDAGLWEGLNSFKDKASACAAFTYGNAVLSYWQDYILQINQDSEIQALLEVFGALGGLPDEDLDDEEQSIESRIEEVMGDYFADETNVESAQAHIRTLLDAEIDQVID